MAEATSTVVHEPCPVPGVAGILAAFDHVPLVALGETHGLQEEADFIAALLHHPAFPTKVNDIVVEVGNARYQAIINRFIAGDTVANADLRPVWRDIVGSPFGMTDAPIYEQFFRTVRAINWALPPTQRLRVLLGDPPIDWSTVQSQDDIQPFLSARDTHYASVVAREVLDRGRRALLIAGSFHFFRKFYPDPAQKNVTQIIEDRHSGSMFVVVPHTGFGSRNDDLEQCLVTWPIPTLARIAGSWLGTLDPRLLFGAGAIVVGPNGEQQPVDLFASAGDLTLSDLVDGYVYLGPRAMLTRSVPNPAVYRGDQAYIAEIQRRHVLMMSQPLASRELFTEQSPGYFDA
jgi:hypothetical protein